MVGEENKELEQQDKQEQKEEKKEQGKRDLKIVITSIVCTLFYYHPLIACSSWFKEM